MESSVETLKLCSKGKRVSRHQYCEPRLKELCRYSEDISTCWTYLALELNLRSETIDAVNVDHTCIRDKCRHMFNRWLERSLDPCWCEIIEALKMIKMSHLAADIEAQHIVVVGSDTVKQATHITSNSNQLTASKTTSAPIRVEGAVIIDQIKDKNERPTMKALNRYVTRKYASDWEDIGMELGLELDVLKIITRDNTLQSIACLRETLNKWLKLNNDDTTWKTLEVALTNVNREKLGLDPVDDVYVVVGSDTVKQATHITSNSNQLITSNTTSGKLDILTENFKIVYKEARCLPVKDQWPPNQPCTIVNVALIHHEGEQTQQELINMSMCNISAVEKLSSYHPRITKRITDILMSSHKCILIEGAPGIGKTVLAKEIAYCWANGEILADMKLLILLFIRDPDLHCVNSINELVHYLNNDYLSDCEVEVAVDEIRKSKGSGIVFVFDGYDECPCDSKLKGFIDKLVERKSLPMCMIVITSRPTASLSLCHFVNQRIKILGLAQKEQDQYISESLKELPEMKIKLQEYLKQQPVISSLIYVPLHLTILLYLFKHGSLPETLTEINELFVMHTIYRHLIKQRQLSYMKIDKITDLPEPELTIVYQLSKLAYKGLCNSQVVFTHDEIKEACPKVNEIPGAINGFGLLETVECYYWKGVGKSLSLKMAAVRQESENILQQRGKQQKEKMAALQARISEEKAKLETALSGKEQNIQQELSIVKLMLKASRLESQSAQEKLTVEQNKVEQLQKEISAEFSSMAESLGQAVAEQEAALDSTRQAHINELAELKQFYESKLEQLRAEVTAKAATSGNEEKKKDSMLKEYQKLLSSNEKERLKLVEEMKKLQEHLEMLSTQNNDHLRTISELQHKNDHIAQSTPIKSPSTPTLDTPSNYITLAAEPHGQEFEYFKNVLFNFMMGKESKHLVKVIASLARFSPDQTKEVVDRAEIL